MRYLVLICTAIFLFSCGDSTPVATDEARDPAIDSAEKYLELYQSVKETSLPYASIYSDLALVYSSRINYHQGVADANAAKGYVQLKLNRDDLGVAALSDALKLYEESNDTAGIAQCCFHLAEAYRLQKNYTEAVSSVNRAISLHESQRNFLLASSEMLLLGKIHAETAEYPFAFTDFEESVYAARQAGDTLSVVKALAGWGSAYTSSGDADQGLAKHLAALGKLDSMLSGNETDVLKFKAVLLNEMAGEYFLSGDYGAAIKTGEAGLKLADSIGRLTEKCAAYKTLAELQGLAGREDIQMQYMEKYIALNDSISRTMSNEWRAASMIRYQLAQADVDAARMQAENLETQLEEERVAAETNLMILAIVSLVVLTGLSVFLIMVRKKTRM
jgi:tetratricopeptide (TPR) repeat protein